MKLSLSELAALGLGTAGVYGINSALADGDNERWDRTAINTVGNLAGAHTLGRMSSNPYVRTGATVLGALGGGYASDRLADMVDPTQGTVAPEELIEVHLQQDPIGQQAYYQEQIRQARLMQKEIERQKMLQYQAQMAQQQGGM